MEPQAILDGYLNHEEAARQLNISPRTLARWHVHRKAPPRTKIGRQVLYKAASIRAWLEEREQRKR